MKRKEEKKYFLLLYYILAIFITLAVVITLNTSSISIHRNYEMQIKASNRSLHAMEVLKEREAEVSKNYDYGDFYETYEDKKYYDNNNLKTGMIGAEYTAITTTIGNLDSKITSLDPNFAAVYIKMFSELSLNKGDEVVINISGSFPMLDISCIIAAEEYGLRPYLMASVGASSFGATNPAFTIFDMLEYLYDQKFTSSRINVVSLGGSGDVGENFGEFNDYNDRNLIIDRINKSGITFLYEKDFDTNIEKRLQLIKESHKNIKLFINIGGNSVGIGINENAFYKSNGIIYANKYKNINSSKKGEGLIGKFLKSGVNAIQMLNLKNIAANYGLEYGFNKLPDVGQGEPYYEKSYNLTYPIIAVVVVVSFLLYYKKKKHFKEI
jgi:poly-gamma-glutamate system protein